MVILLDIIYPHWELLVLQWKGVIILFEYRKVPVLVRSYMNREIVIAKGWHFRCSIRITFTFLKWDFNAFVCKGLQGNRKLCSDHANVLWRCQVKDRSAQGTAYSNWRSGLPHNDGVIGDNRGIGNNSREIVPYITGRSWNMLLLGCRGKCTNQKRWQQKWKHSKRKMLNMQFSLNIK